MYKNSNGFAVVETNYRFMDRGLAWTGVVKPTSETQQHFIVWSRLYLKRGFCLRQGSLQSFLNISQCVCLSNHLIHLMSDLGFPKSNVVDTFSQILGGVRLGLPDLLILVLNQTRGIHPQSLRIVSRHARLLKVGEIGPVPVIRSVPREQRSPIGDEGQHRALGHPLRSRTVWSQGR